MPRPDLKVIGTAYRRIPVLAIGRDIYNDTRLILSKLEELYPDATRISASAGDQKGIERLLERWVVDAGVFVRASQLIPLEAPMMNDPVFSKDREGFAGRPFSKESRAKLRPEALVEMWSCFNLLETTWLADEREWILKSNGPSLADIEGMFYMFRLHG